MSHRSRLSQAVARKQLSCIVCGCTEDNACLVDGKPCHWVSPGLCSNSACVEVMAEDPPLLLEDA